MTAMSIVAHPHALVFGADTHARNHVYAIIAATTSELVDTRGFPTTGAGINRAIAWVARRTGADLAALWAIEGAASCGAILAGAVAGEGYPVVEATRMDARARYGVGKSELDARRIARVCAPLGGQSIAPAKARRGHPCCAEGFGVCTWVHDR